MGNLKAEDPFLERVLFQAKQIHRTERLKQNKTKQNKHKKWTSPLPALAFLPLHSPHLTAKSILLSFKRWICLLQAGPQGQEPNLACPQTRGRPVPRPSPCALFPGEQPSVAKAAGTALPRLTLGHSLQKEGPRLQSHSLGLPDTAWGSLALLRKTSGTLW